MKKLLIALTFWICGIASAQQCVMMLPFAPGGSSDLYARIIQKYNPNIRIEYKPGAFASQVVAAMEQNKSVFLATTPTMYSSANPNKDPGVELLQVLFPIDAVIMTGKDIVFSDLLNKKINFAIPTLGQNHHVVSLALKEKNPQLEIVPMGSDIKALPALLNKEVDALAISAPIANEWVAQHPQLKIIANIPVGKPFVSNGVVLENMNFWGLFVNRDASAEQKQSALNCVNQAAAQPGHDEDFKRVGITTRRTVGAEKDKLLSDYIRVMKKYGL